MTNETDAQAARIAELEERNTALGEAVAYATQRFTEAEAKLAKAVALAPEILASLDATGCNVSLAADYRTTIAELKEQNSE